MFIEFIKAIRCFHNLIYKDLFPINRLLSQDSKFNLIVMNTLIQLNAFFNIHTQLCDYIKCITSYEIVPSIKVPALIN